MGFWNFVKSLFGNDPTQYVENDNELSVMHAIDELRKSGKLKPREIKEILDAYAKCIVHAGRELVERITRSRGDTDPTNLLNNKQPEPVTGPRVVYNGEKTRSQEERVPEK